MAEQEIIKRLSSIEIGDGEEDDDSLSSKTKSLIDHGDGSEPSPPKKVTTLFRWPSLIEPKDPESESESTKMPSVEHGDAASESSQVSVFSMIDPTELETDSPKQCSSTSGSGSGSPSGSGSLSGSDSGSGSASSTSSVESTCSTLCLVLQITAVDSMSAGRAAAPAENISDESDPSSVLLDHPNTFIMRAFSRGWNESMEGVSVLPATDDDFSTLCSVLTTAAYTTGIWFDSYDNSPKRLPGLVCFELFLAWKNAGSCIGRYVLSKYGYEKHLEMEDFRDFFTCGRF